MKTRAMSRVWTAAAVVFAAAFIASAAQAFTVQDSSGSAAGAGFMDLDKPAAPPDRLAPVNRFGTDSSGQTTYKSGSGTFQFGQQRSFDQRYNTENIFNPYARDGR
jgi:hypothetical protein